MGIPHLFSLLTVVTLSKTVASNVLKGVIIIKFSIKRNTSGVKRWFIISVLLVVAIATGCSNTSEIDNDPFPVSSMHVEYLETLGWHVEKGAGVTLYSDQLPTDIAQTLEGKKLGFSQFKGKNIMEYSYILKEKEPDGGRIHASVFEVDEKIIGSRLMK